MVNRVGSSFPKGGHSATQTKLKNNLNKHKVKRHRNSDTNNRQKYMTFRLHLTRVLLDSKQFSLFYIKRNCIQFYDANVALILQKNDQETRQVQCLNFRHIDSTIPQCFLNPKFLISSHLMWLSIQPGLCRT